LKSFISKSILTLALQLKVKKTPFYLLLFLHKILRVDEWRIYFVVKKRLGNAFYTNFWNKKMENAIFPYIMI
jgi:hypothetical protein